MFSPSEKPIEKKLSEEFSRVNSSIYFDVKVFAFVHISSTEKEQGIEAKPVTYFLALLPPPEGGSTTVTAQIDGSSQPPLIHLRISERARPQ